MLLYWSQSIIDRCSRDLLHCTSSVQEATPLHDDTSLLGGRAEATRKLDLHCTCSDGSLLDRLAAQRVVSRREEIPVIL